MQLPNAKYGFKNYDSLSKDEKSTLWKWFYYDYLKNLNWPRKYAYALFFDLIKNENMPISARQSSNLTQFYSSVIGEGILEEDCIRFRGEPEDLDDLENYLASTNWLEEE